MLRIVLSLTTLVSASYPFFLPWPDTYLSKAGVNVEALFKENHPVGAIAAVLSLRWATILLLGLCVALLVVRMLRVAASAPHLHVYKKWLTAGLLGTGLYLVALSLMFLLSGGPYGGGKVPTGVHFIMLASWLALAYGLAQTLMRELPVVRAGGLEKKS